jgi:hypothetical protein
VIERGKGGGVKSEGIVGEEFKTNNAKFKKGKKL